MVGVYDDARDVLGALERLGVRDPDLRKWERRFQSVFLPMPGNDRLAVLREAALELQAAIRAGGVGGSLALQRRVWTLVNTLERLDLLAHAPTRELVASLEAAGEAFTLVAPGGDDVALSVLARLPFGSWGRVDWAHAEPDLHLQGDRAEDVAWALEHWRSRLRLADPTVFVVRFDAEAPHLELRLSSLIRHAGLAFPASDDAWVIDPAHPWVLEADHDGHQRFVVPR